MNTVQIALSAAGLGVGVVSTGIAAMSLIMREARRAASRVRYAEGQYLVDVRYFGWLDIRDFVQPTNPDVVALYLKYGPDYWPLYDFVCRAISYRSDFGEYWYFPEETLRGEGDCEDTSILLCSLLQNSFHSYVALGSYQGYGHAWVYLGQILETTYTRAQVTLDPGNYVPYLYFNDREVIELWPGALQDIYSVPRAEATKLRLMGCAG